MQKERGEEREQFRDLEERLLRTEQFADQALAAQTKLEADATRLQADLAVSPPGCLILFVVGVWGCYLCPDP